MPVYGSSVIQNISGSPSLTGPIGPTGPRGVTGFTGPTGSTGHIGATGVSIISGPTGASGGNSIRYFEEHEHGGEWITFSLTDGSTLGVSGARGETGADQSNSNFEIINTIEDDYHAQIFSHKEGITAHFRNITVSGRDIEIDTTDDFTIMIRGTTYDYGILGITGELLYQYNGLSAHGALNTNWDNGNYNLKAKIAVHREANTTRNIVTDDFDSVGNLDNVQTMVGSTGPTLRTEGIAVPFEYIKYDEINKSYESRLGFDLGMTSDDRPNSAVPGASAEILYLAPSSKIEKLLASSSDDAEVITYGSCCYCSSTEEVDRSDCVDYVTETYCNNINGKFDSSNICFNRPEGPNCNREGSCCVNGICIESGKDKCEQFGGFFVENLACYSEGEEDSIESLGGCPEACGGRGACCVNNICYDLTEYECSFEPNSIFFEEPCDDVNCCLEAQYGACCIDETCYETTPQICSTLTDASGNPGIFWGVGSSCAGPEGNWSDLGTFGTYAPFDCVDGEGKVIDNSGIQEDGNCVDGSGPPPCNSCLGWTLQEFNGTCADGNLCQCGEDGLGKPCAPSCVDAGNFGCTICGGETLSCGSIVLSSGECWRCCCGSDFN